MSQVHHSLALSALALIVGCATSPELPAGHGALVPRDQLESELMSEQLSDVEWANQFFMTQIYDPRWHPDGMETDDCAVCPVCMDCSVVGTTTLRSGWAFFGAGEAYRCPGAEKFEACPALLLNQNTTMDSSTCAVGYTESKA